MADRTMTASHVDIVLGGIRIRGEVTAPEGKLVIWHEQVRGRNRTVSVRVSEPRAGTAGHEQEVTYREE